MVWSQWVAAEAMEVSFSYKMRNIQMIYNLKEISVQSQGPCTYSDNLTIAYHIVHSEFSKPLVVICVWHSVLFVCHVYRMSGEHDFLQQMQWGLKSCISRCILHHIMLYSNWFVKVGLNSWIFEFYVYSVSNSHIQSSADWRVKSDLKKYIPRSLHW